MTKIEASIVIDRPVAEVKKAFFDFENYPKWSRFIVSVENTTNEPGVIPVENDVLAAKVQPANQSAMEFNPVVLTSTENEFVWKGNVAFDFLFLGVHTFEFVSLEDGTKTKFSQAEKFTGWFSWPLLYFISQSTAAGFKNFNSSLKNYVEGNV